MATAHSELFYLLSTQSLLFDDRYAVEGDGILRSCCLQASILLPRAQRLLPRDSSKMASGCVIAVNGCQPSIERLKSLDQTKGDDVRIADFLGEAALWN